MNNNFQQLQIQIKNCLSARQWQDDGASFVMSPRATEPTLMALSFAILVQELFGLLPSAHAATWADHLQTAQNPETGLFVDPRLHPDHIEIGSPGIDYVTQQTTYFAVAALDALQQRPHHNLKFATDLAQNQKIERWLTQLDWSQPWAASNWVMFLATALYTEWQWYDDNLALAGVHTVLDWLDEHQDPETGLWGIMETVPLAHSMAAAYHFVPYYFCLSRKLHYVHKMIDSTLSLQADDGLFHPSGGGDSCLDVDAIDILVKCSLVTSYRADDIELALGRAYIGLMANQTKDGGFCRARHCPPPPKSRKRQLAETFGIDKLMGRPYVIPPNIWNYSGWRAMPFDIRESDLWSTWFRSFGLALISTRYPAEYLNNDLWVFRRLPALGWHDPGLIAEPAGNNFKSLER